MEQLTTFIINLSRRTERKAAVLKEFENRKEFDVHIFDAYEEKRGAWGLWRYRQQLYPQMGVPSSLENLIIILP